MMKKIIYLMILCFLCTLCSCDDFYETRPVIDDGNVTVTFDSMGGTGISKQTIKKGDSAKFPDVTPFRQNYKFLYWCSDSELNDEYDFNNPVITNITLYAKWENLYKDYSFLLDDIPDIIDDDIVFPRYYNDVDLIWKTSNEYVLSNFGVVNKSYYNEDITIYLEVYDNGYSTFYEKNVCVPALVLKELNTGRIISGYYSSWNFCGYNDILKKSLDIVNLCFAYVNDDYTLDVSSVEKLLGEMTSAHKNNIRVILSVQGYSSEGKNFSNAAKTESGRATLANSMLEVVEKYHLDGIDIDWEYPGFNTGTSTAIDRENYTLLMKKINETLKNASPNYLLTAAIPGSGTASRFDLKNVAKYLDFINVMTYDLQSGGAATHHTALYDSAYTPYGSVDSSVKYYLNNDVPSNKIIIGLAFYGRYTYASNIGASAANGYKTITYSKIYSDYLPRIGIDVEYHFDEIAKAPYLLDKTNGIYITYDDNQSVSLKCMYAIDNQLAGVMIWEIGEDISYTLINEIYKTMKRY